MRKLQIFVSFSFMVVAVTSAIILRISEHNLTFLEFVSKHWIFWLVVFFGCFAIFGLGVSDD